MLDDGLDELIDGEERVRVDAEHVPQLLLVGRLVDVAVKELLGEIQRMLVVAKCWVVPLVDDGHLGREAKVDGEGAETLGTFGGEGSAPLLKR